MPHTRTAEAVCLAASVTPHVGVGMSDALGRLVAANGDCEMPSHIRSGLRPQPIPSDSHTVLLADVLGSQSLKRQLD